MYISDIRDNTELYDVARLFFGDGIGAISLGAEGAKFTVEINGASYSSTLDDRVYDIIPEAHKFGRLSKIALYDALSRHTGREMPWGALTGVRPTKLFYECLNAGKSPAEACDVMRRVYGVSASRASILSEIVDAQKGKISFPSEYINLYIHVPYCTSRCTYCSFISSPVSKNRAQSERYTELLCEEISRSLAFLSENGKKLLSVYIGGGTPTALDDNSFSRILDAVGDNGCEYTCEAGRPDTITAEKARIMREHGVTRVCVNPQTLNDGTLSAIGRHHTAEQFFLAYDIIKEQGFEINCDLIAGLPGESEEDFAASFDGVKRLAPQNITVHSLSKKNGSVIRYDEGENDRTLLMTEYALRERANYRPYYLYRQKRQACNLENIGFSVAGAECVNNITTMEETVSVLACGAGAISKAVGKGVISRFANMRDVSLYINRFEEKLDAKLGHFQGVFDGRE